MVDLNVASENKSGGIFIERGFVNHGRGLAVQCGSDGPNACGDNNRPPNPCALKITRPKGRHHRASTNVVSQTLPPYGAQNTQKIKSD